jgi:hypothetical protein
LLPEAGEVRCVKLEIDPLAPQNALVNSNRTTTILAVVIAVLVVLLGWRSFSYFRLYVASANAEWQTRSFEELRTVALKQDAAGAIGCLEHLLIDYPSGTKQRRDSHLDRTVERHRAAVAREIIAYLRRTTGKDFGDDPEAWICKYEKSE